VIVTAVSSATGLAMAALIFSVSSAGIIVDQPSPTSK
jgi:hypothetical protein